MSKSGFIIALGLVASIITILTFVTGVPNLQNLSKQLSPSTTEQVGVRPGSQSGVPSSTELGKPEVQQSQPPKEQAAQDGELQRLAETRRREEMEQQRAEEEARRAAEQSIEPHQKVAAPEFTFELDRISRIGSSLLVEVVITSSHENSDICIVAHGGPYSPSRNTALYDQAGNEYSPSTATIGNFDLGSGQCLLLVTGIPTRAKITFDNFPLNNRASALALSWGTHWYISPGNAKYEGFISTFRNIR